MSTTKIDGSDEHEEDENGKKLTALLHKAGGGDSEAQEELVQFVCKHMKPLACLRMANERNSHTLTPTALLHEALIRLTFFRGQEWKTAEHRGMLLRTVSEAMRRVLIDHARRRSRHKRGQGWKRVPLDDVIAVMEEKDGVDVAALDASLTKLKRLRPLAAEVITLRYFGGLTWPAVAEALGVTDSTARHADIFACTWLRRELLKGGNDDA